MLLLIACTGSEDSQPQDTEPTAPTEAVLQLAFEIDDDLLTVMDEPAQGSFHGSVFAEADAGATGPVDGADSLFDFVSDPLDLSSSTSSGLAYVSEPFSPQIVWVLGCLDSDGNDCDSGDAVTIPNENKFEAVAGDNALTIQLNILQP